MRRLDKDLVRRGDFELWRGQRSVSNLPNWQNRRVRRRSHAAEKNAIDAIVAIVHRSTVSFAVPS